MAKIKDIGTNYVAPEMDEFAEVIHSGDHVLVRVLGGTLTSGYTTREQVTIVAQRKKFLKAVAKELGVAIYERGTDLGDWVITDKDVGYHHD